MPANDQAIMKRVLITFFVFVATRCWGQLDAEMSHFVGEPNAPVAPGQLEPFWREEPYADSYHVESNELFLNHQQVHSSLRTDAQKIAASNQQTADSTKPSQAVDSTECDQENEDDRTLLDVFGEVAKEYLTQKVIQETDTECVWDWQSVRCEPFCECEFQFHTGDYHLGRACRLRPEPMGACQLIHPSRVLLDRPATQRFISLVTQTVRIIKEKSKDTYQKTSHNVLQCWYRLQYQICGDLWMIQKHVTTCTHFSELPIRSIPERMICGKIDIPICEEDNSESTTHRVFGDVDRAL